VTKHWQPGVSTKEQIDALLKRDGNLCWLCDEPIDFKAQPGSSNAPTREHLLSQCHDGPDRIENLVLCHGQCNRVLRDRSVAEKVKLRDKRRRKKWKTSIRTQILKVLGG
jgi:5-methylcytosine-specific restriction endonuclease McrA